eukprot:g14114.t1
MPKAISDKHFPSCYSAMVPMPSKGTDCFRPAELIAHNSGLSQYQIELIFFPAKRLLSYILSDSESRPKSRRFSITDQFG